MCNKANNKSQKDIFSRLTHHFIKLSAELSFYVYANHAIIVHVLG